MMIPTSMRASALPLAFKCPGSLMPATIAVNETGDAAMLGSATHEALRSLAERGDVEWHRIPAIAASFGAPADEITMLVRMARLLWPSLKESFAGALTEVPLSADIGGGFTLTGHADLLAIHDNVARAADWKTGRADSDYSAQMRAYAALVMLENQNLAEVTVTVIWIRDGEIENYTMNRAALADWLRDLRARVLTWDGVFHPGSHCRYCPRSHECEARLALIRRDIAALTTGDLTSRIETALATMGSEAVIELHRKATGVIDAASRVREAIKAHVKASGDVVADGTRLTVEVQERRELNAERAWPVMENFGFESADFAACIDLHISRVEKTIAHKAGRGKGAARARALLDALETAGAIRFREQEILRVKRT